MLTKKEQSVLRNQLFRHLDGIVVAPISYALDQEGVTEYLLVNKRVTLSELTSHFDANNGYLNVALRALCSQGWLTQEVDNIENKVTFSINEHSETAFDHFYMYKDVVELMKVSENYSNRIFEIEPFLKLESTFQKYQNQFGITLSTDKSIRKVQEQILTHIEGIIAGPTLVHLGMSGMFHKYFMQTRFRSEEFHKDPDAFGRLLDILVSLGWFKKINEAFEFTDHGLFFAKRASAYGVTVSYIPMLRKVTNLIFGNPLVLKNTIGAEEKHVDREMNVWGSGGAHAAYFRIVDEIIISIFNKPIDEQPKGFLDMGCGNGAFLAHLFSVVENQTSRGRMLDEYPLLIIGVDYNQAALKVSRNNLIQADIWAKIIWGDIGNPDLLAKDLKEKYNIRLEDLLNVRTFLDHNRMWEMPQETVEIRKSTSTGAYAFEGKRLHN
ncbi:MAG: class I SAM-dependent methyltransferase, partial [Flavobacteriaceae bacterium]|nr:class I SAM-dependent methyltransferase [Flavobacteriaceae bacterium]